MTWQARQHKGGHARHHKAGMARLGKPGRGCEWPAPLGVDGSLWHRQTRQAWLGLSPRAVARQAWHGRARLCAAGNCRQGNTRRPVARRSMAWQGRQGATGQPMAWRRYAGTASLRRHGHTWQARHGLGGTERLLMAGMAWHDGREEAWLASIGTDRRRSAWCGWRGNARQRKTSPGKAGTAAQAADWLGRLGERIGSGFGCCRSQSAAEWLQVHPPSPPHQ